MPTTIWICPHCSLELVALAVACPMTWHAHSPMTDEPEDTA